LNPPFAVRSCDTVLQTRTFSVERRIVSNDVETFERQVVHHAGAVAILPIREDGAVGILRQYRATFDDVNWELPAGTRDVLGEEPVAAAARELLEEMGCRAGRWRELYHFMNSRGWTDQTTILFEATDLTMELRHPEGPEESAAEVHWLNAAQLQSLVNSGQPVEASTLLAIVHLLGQTP
jgi:8-oxo-dGDP phosphatase